MDNNQLALDLLNSINEFTADKQSQFEYYKNQYLEQKEFRTFSGSLFFKNVSQALSYISKRKSKLNVLSKQYVEKKLNSFTTFKDKKKNLPLIRLEALEKYGRELSFLENQRIEYIDIFNKYIDLKEKFHFFTTQIELDGEEKNISVNLQRGKLYALPFAKSLIKLAAKTSKVNSDFLVDKINKYLPQDVQVPMTDFVQDTLDLMVLEHDFSGDYIYNVEVEFQGFIARYLSSFKIKVNPNISILDKIVEYIDGEIYKSIGNVDEKYLKGIIAFNEKLTDFLGGGSVAAISDESNSLFEKATKQTNNKFAIDVFITIVPAS